MCNVHVAVHPCMTRRNSARDKKASRLLARARLMARRCPSLWRDDAARAESIDRRVARTRSCSYSARFRLQVHWFQQQHEKKRKKRDFESAPYAFVGFPPFFDFRTRSRHIGTTQQPPRIRTSLPFQNLFTDPLFKEQWYLVSRPLAFYRSIRVADRIRDANRRISRAKSRITARSSLSRSRPSRDLRENLPTM